MSFTPSIKQSKTEENDDAAALFEKYYKEMTGWPSLWEIKKQDREIGEAIIDEFASFLMCKIQQDCGKSTLSRYTRYLYVLGNELIRQINDYELNRKLSARELILELISTEGGPYWRDAFDENEHNQFESVCRTLYKFMTT